MTTTRPQTPATGIDPVEVDTGRRTLLVACAGAFLALVNYTLPLTTLTTISGAVGASSSEQTWILSGISLGVAALLLTSGSLADDFGRKRVFLVGLGVFVVASLACTFAPTGLTFVVGRIVQGLGTAAVLSSSLGLLAVEFPTGEARTHATGMWGAMIGAGIAVGPVVAALLARWEWRSAYGLLAALSAVLLWYGARTLRESRAATHSPVDWGGVLTLGGGLVALLAALVRGNRYGWTSTGELVLLGVGVALLVAFVAIEARRSHPMIDLGLFRTSGFSAALVASTATGASVVALMTYFPTFLQRALHVGITGAALLLLGWSATSYVVAAQARRIARVMSPRAQLTAGLLLVAAGLASMLGVTSASGQLRVLPGLVVSGIGTGLLNAGLARAAVDTVPAHRASMGSGANNTARYLGNGIGVAVLIAALQTYAQHRAGSLLHAVPGAPVDNSPLAALLASGQLDAARRGAPGADGDALAAVAASVQASGMQVALLVAVAVAVIGAVVAYAFLPRRGR